MKLDWNKLITSKRLGADNLKYKYDDRTEFERDVDRIIFSSSFRRLQDKTQVFPMPKSDFVHSRLTHSIEVASIGKSLGKIAGQFILKKEGNISDPNGQEEINANTFGDIVAAACLCHDIGNPPFGHSGEESFRLYYSNFFDKIEAEKFKELTKREKDDFYRFEGNAEGFRIITNDHPSGVPGGLKLTYTTLSVFCKYPIEGGEIDLNVLGRKINKRRSKKKLGIFQKEKEIYYKIGKELELLNLSESNLYFCRHPLSFLVEAADNICYQIMDLEDGHKLGLVETSEVIKLLEPIAFSIKGDPCDKNSLESIKDKYEKIGAYRAKSINSLIYQVIEVFKENYNKIMTANFDSELTDHIKQKKEFDKINALKPELFSNFKIIAMESAGRHVIKGLLDLYIDAFLNLDKKYGKNLICNLPTIYKVNENESPYDVLLKLTSYISRMTDSYAIDLYRTLSGHKLPEII